MFRDRSVVLWKLAVILMTAFLSPGAAADAEQAENDPLATYPQSAAFAHHLDWHTQVREYEIRTSWFLNGSPGVAMVCTADLSASKVTTSREVYEHASHSTKTRELSHAQVLTLRKLIGELPPLAEAPEFKNLLLVSVVENGKVKTRLYNRLKLPRKIVRLYDLTGAYVVAEDPHEPDLSEEEATRVLLRHAKARIDGTQPPASWPKKIRRVGSAWVVDIDTSRLPGGYAEQIVVEVTYTGGHSNKPKIGDK